MKIIAYETTCAAVTVLNGSRSLRQFH